MSGTTPSPVGSSPAPIHEVFGPILIGLFLGGVMGLGVTPGITVAVLGIISALLAAVGIAGIVGKRFATFLASGLILGLGLGLGLRVGGALLVVQGPNGPVKVDVNLFAGEAGRADELGEEAGRLLEKLNDPKDSDLKAKVQDLKAYADYSSLAGNKLKALEQDLAARDDASALKKTIQKYLKEASPKGEQPPAAP